MLPLPKDYAKESLILGKYRVDPVRDIYYNIWQFLTGVDKPDNLIYHTIYTSSIKNG